MDAIFDFWETGLGVKGEPVAFSACEDLVRGAGKGVCKVFRAGETDFFLKVEVEAFEAGRASKVAVFKSLPRVRGFIVTVLEVIWSKALGLALTDDEPFSAFITDTFLTTVKAVSDDSVTEVAFSLRKVPS